MGSRVDYDAPGHSSTTMAYSADGTRFRDNYLPLPLIFSVALLMHEVV